MLDENDIADDNNIFWSKANNIESNCYVIVIVQQVLIIK